MPNAFWTAAEQVGKRDEEIARLCAELEQMRSRIAELKEILVTLNGPDWADMFSADEDW